MLTRRKKNPRTRSDLLNKGGLVVATFNRGEDLSSFSLIDRPIPHSNEIEVDSWVTQVPLIVCGSFQVSSIGW